MTSLDASSHPLAEVLTRAFATLSDEGAVDIVSGDRDDSWELQADQWTLALDGWPLSVAFLAIDEEPAGRDELQLALLSALGPGDLAAMRAVDRALDGGLTTALHQSGDILSAMLAPYLADGPDRVVVPR